MTPHIETRMGEIAKTVLMPGDPLRAKFIAANFLEDAQQFNGVRGMLGFTGNYKGHQLSVMGSGMGIPSMGIYAYELYKFFEVETIIRVGTAGGIAEGIALRDIVIAQGACTDSNFISQYGLNGTFAPIADFGLVTSAVNAAKSAGKTPRVGNVLTSDVFYGDNPNTMKDWQKMGVLAVEMEAAALYTNAHRAGKNALAICTISDKVFCRDELMTAKERETSFSKMIELALSMV